MSERGSSTGEVDIEWTSPHRFVVEGTAFVHDYRSGSTAESFHIRKHRTLAEAYIDVLSAHRGARIVELGIATGGSAALIELIARPERLVALELDVERVAALDELVARRGAEDRIRAHYGVDQGDRELVRSLVTAELGDSPIDLVIDDASHLYAPTLASFETLFPLVRPGGRYLIEDWTWQFSITGGFEGLAESGSDEDREVLAEQLRPAILAGLRDPDPEARRRFAEQVEARLRAQGDEESIEEMWAQIRAEDAGDVPGPAPSDDVTPPVGALDLGLLPRLVFQFVIAAAREGSAIASVTADPHWISVTRGDAPLDPLTFRLDDIVDDPFGLV